MWPAPGQIQKDSLIKHTSKSNTSNDSCLNYNFTQKMLARSNKRLRTFQRHDGWLNDQILHTKTVKSEKICRWGHVIFVSAFFNISVRQHDALSGLLKRLARARSNNLPTDPNILDSLQSKQYVLCTSWQTIYIIHMDKISVGKFK